MKGKVDKFLSLALFLTVMFFLNACVAFHDNLYLLDKNYLQRRSIETRVFSASKEKDILIASAQVLQDMGYTIKESETAIGLITAEKNRQVISTAEKVTINVLSAIAGTDVQYEDVQRFYVTIVTSKSDKDNVGVRVLFTRKSWDNKGNIFAIEKIDDPKIYKQFFEKLNKSVFLAAHGI
ncbi:MAG: hypothetical protein LBU55_03685 [Elusimicrobiota bacterium]|jgi:hypothetical protein|nr:hypothetical protein [Elusimicrobiota bacterium]